MMEEQELMGMEMPSQKENALKQIGYAKKINIAVFVVSFLVFLVFNLMNLATTNFALVMNMLWIVRIISLVLVVLSIVVLVQLNKYDIKGGIPCVIATTLMFIMSVIGAMIGLVLWMLVGFSTKQLEESKRELLLHDRLQQSNTSNPVESVALNSNFQLFEQAAQDKIDLEERKSVATISNWMPVEMFGERTINVSEAIMNEAILSTIGEESIQKLVRDEHAVEIFLQSKVSGFTYLPETVYSRIAFQYQQQPDGSLRVLYNYAMRSQSLLKVVISIMTGSIILMGIGIIALVPPLGIFMIVLGVSLLLLVFSQYRPKNQEKAFTKNILKRIETMIAIIYQNQQ